MSSFPSFQPSHDLELQGSQPGIAGRLGHPSTPAGDSVSHGVRLRGFVCVHFSGSLFRSRVWVCLHLSSAWASPCASCCARLCLCLLMVTISPISVCLRLFLPPSGSVCLGHPFISLALCEGLQIAPLGPLFPSLTESASSKCLSEHTLSLLFLPLHFFLCICLFIFSLSGLWPRPSLRASPPPSLPSGFACALSSAGELRIPRVRDPACPDLLSAPAFPPFSCLSPRAKDTRSRPAPGTAFIPQGPSGPQWWIGEAQPSNFFLRPSIPLSASMFLRQSPTSRFSCGVVVRG